MQVTDKTDVQALERHLLQLEANHAKENKRYAAELKKMKLQLDLTEQRKNELTQQLRSLREESKHQSQQVASLVNTLLHSKSFGKTSTSTTLHSRGSTTQIPAQLDTTPKARPKPKQATLEFRQPVLKNIRSCDQKSRKQLRSAGLFQISRLAKMQFQTNFTNKLQNYSAGVSSPQVERKLPLQRAKLAHVIA